MSSLDLALSYLERGWSVIPLKPGSKTSHSEALMTSGRGGGWKWAQTAHASEDEVRAWFKVDPTCGIAILLGPVSGIVVVDYDKGVLPEIVTPSVRTRRGAHFYLASRETIRTQAFDHDGLKGELRGLGGYVAAPPSVHPSGHVYEWIVHPDDVSLLTFEEVRDLLGVTVTERSSSASRHREQKVVSTRLTPSDYVPVLTLTPDQSTYMEQRLPKGARDQAGCGEVEFEIMLRMVRQGYSDPEILAWFLAHQPPKFMERGESWFRYSVSNARLEHKNLLEGRDRDSSSLSSYLYWETGCISEEPEYEVENPRPLGWMTRRWTALRKLPEGLRVSEAGEWISEEHSIKRTQATEDLRWLRENGWLDYRPDPEDRRVRRVYRTESADQLLAGRHPWQVPYGFLIGLGTPSTPAEQDSDEELLDQVEETEVEQEPTRQPDDPLAALSAEERRRERSLINDTFRIHISGTPVTYIQLLSPPDEWRTALFHEQLRVGLDADGLTVRRSFISPTDDALLGEDATDPLSERVLADGGFDPSNRRFAWAVQLEKTPAGFEIAHHDDGGVMRPSVGLIVQAYRNFFAPIERLPDPTGVILKVRRHKTTIRQGEKKTDFSHEVAGKALPLSFDLPDLDDFLTEMFEAQDDLGFLDSLPDDWKLVWKLPWQEEIPLSKRLKVIQQVA